MKHANIAIFIPHNGCHNQCSFCNQKDITGISHQPTPDEVKDILNNAVNNLKKNYNTEIAFFGGSFTAIPRDYMISLLEVASYYVKNGYFTGVRISTRPDAIDEDILNILYQHNVTAIELGAQSMNNDVLKFNLRGHTREDIIYASKLIKDRGFSLGLQMMTGLYKSNFDIDYQTGLDILDLAPDTVRIYPTVILKGTMLEQLYNDGFYKTLSFEETVKLCSKLLLLFKANEIPVIRLGLHFSESLKENMIAGVFHPAFGEICESQILFDRVCKLIHEKNIEPGILKIKIHSREVSKLIGQNRCNLKRFSDAGYILKIVQDNSINDNILIENCR